MKKLIIFAILCVNFSNSYAIYVRHETAEEKKTNEIRAKEREISDLDKEVQELGALIKFKSNEYQRKQKKLIELEIELEEFKKNK